ncbi:MAG: hypothetical protein AAF264_14435 [Pseudomonadota bacterium]
MFPSRVIHLAAIRYDVLCGGYEGVVIRREGNGDLTRRPVRMAGDPSWSHEEAAHRLAGCTAD